MDPLLYPELFQRSLSPEELDELAAEASQAEHWSDTHPPIPVRLGFADRISCETKTLPTLPSLEWEQFVDPLTQAYELDLLPYR